MNGAFCTQCGKPVSAAAAQAPPPQPGCAAPPPQAGYAAAPQPVKRKTSPLVWVLVAVLGLFVIGCIGLMGTGLFIAHKVRQAGIDPDLMRRNPGLAVSRLIAAANPNMEVVKTDDNAGTITVRDRHTGKVVTMTFDDARNGRFRMTTTDDDGQTATMQFGGDVGKLPSWVPEYPGSKSAGTFAIKGADNHGTGEGGNFTFTTSDAPAKVMQFYKDKASELGMKVNVTTETSEGGMIVATDEGDTRSLTVVIGSGSGGASVNVTYGSKR